MVKKSVPGWCWQNIPDNEWPCGLSRPEAGRMPGKDAGGMAAFLAGPWPATGGGPLPLRSEELAMLASVFLSEQIWIPSYNNIKIGNGFLGNICTEENIKIVGRYSHFIISKNCLARMEAEPTVAGLNMLNKVPSCVTWLLAEGTRIKFRFWKKYIFILEHLSSRWTDSQEFSP